jgi:hypothetical protein
MSTSGNILEVKSIVDYNICNLQNNAYVLQKTVSLKPQINNSAEKSKSTKYKP